MSQVNHYEILGVSSSATNADLKREYRNLVKQYHPDINPAAGAKNKIRLINEAYEVLSEHYSRAAYDLMLSGVYETPNHKPPKETESEKYRREYRRKKAHEQRERLEYMIRIKSKFYKYERMVSFLFFGMGVLFTVDYYYSSHIEDYRIFKMGANHKKARVTINEEIIYTDFGLYEEYESTGSDVIYVEFSSVFWIPTKVGLNWKSKMYDTHYTLHSFGNVFTIFILIFSSIVIKHKEYTDFRLSCGLVPILLLVFQLLFVTTGGGF